MKHTATSLATLWQYFENKVQLFQSHRHLSKHEKHNRAYSQVRYKRLTGAPSPRTDHHPSGSGVRLANLGSDSPPSSNCSEDFSPDLEAMPSSLSRVHPSRWLPRALQPVPAIVAGIMIHLTLGTMYSIGNMVPYLVSYSVSRGSSVNNHDAGWLTSMATIGQGCTLVLGGILERILGPRLAALVGCFLVSFGTFISFFTIKSSFWACGVTYGLIFGFGVGIAYAPPIVCATRWLPRYKGLIIGFIVGGFGCGALIFNQVQTKFINPNNVKVSSEDGLFHDKDLLARVPYAFLVLGACYSAMQLIAFCLMFDAPEDHHENLDQDNNLSAREFFSLHPLKVLRSPTFYIIWITFLFNGQVSGFISPYYKLFGQTFIDDDSFLATTGSLASLLNALGRIFWGHLADHFSYQVAMASMTALLTFLFLTLQISVKAGKAFYLIWILLIYFGFSGSFALLPFATVKCFGQAYLGVNYGLVFTSQVVTSVISALLAQKLLGVINYDGIFFLVAGFAFISFMLTTFIGVTPHGHPPNLKIVDSRIAAINYASMDESSESENEKSDSKHTGDFSNGTFSKSVLSL